MKILIVDVETAPNIAYVWRCFKENVGAKQLIEESYLLSFAAKWLGSKGTYYAENRNGNEAALVSELVALLDEADVVIAHNAAKFDVPTIRGRALVLGINPPSPFRVIDTLLVARKQFRFPLNTLEALANILECAPKKSHEKFPGFELWLQCLKQNDEAWAEMREYNIQDVDTLEEIYLKMRPWIPNHPNVGNITEEEFVCPTCGSEHVHKRGFYHTQVGKYQRYRCKACGAWSSERHSVRKGGSLKGMLKSV